MKISMYKSLILMLAACCWNVTSQQSDYPYVVVDRFSNCPEMEWNKDNLVFQLKDIHQSRNDIEIRLNIRTGRALGQEVITIKNGEYDANLYYKTLEVFKRDHSDSIKKYGKGEKFPFLKFHIEKKDLKSIYSKLRQYHINSIPNQSDIDKESFFTTFFLECKINNKFSTCYFGGGKELADQYPNVQAFKDYVGIISAFDDLAADYYRNAIILAMSINHR